MDQKILATPQWRAAKMWLRVEGVQSPLLISSSRKSILQDIVDELAMLAVCEAGDSEPCRECVPCYQAETRIHPDIISYTPEKLTIPIKAIRSLLAQLSRKALGKHRLIIINDIHKLSIPSANALLKAFEEPAHATRYVLTTSWPQRLLPTILSRCQKLRFHIQNIEDGKGAGEQAWQKGLLQRLATYDSKSPLDEDTLHHITETLTKQLREQGPSPELRRAILRLRDYYRITGTRGNERFARDVLLSSLP